MIDNIKRIGVLWDMDGVIVDSGDAHYRSWVEALGRSGLTMTREFFDETFGMNNKGILTTLLGHPPTEEQRLTIGKLKEELYRADVAGNIAPLPGVLSWIDRFARAGCVQAVASSAPVKNIDAIVDGLGLRTRFQALVSGSDLPGKPAPDTFLLAAEQLNRPPEDCLVIEDAKVGVRAAKAAGMRCLAVCTTHEPFELDQADLVVPGLDDLTPEAVATLWG